MQVFLDENTDVRLILGRVLTDTFTPALPVRAAESILLMGDNDRIIWQAPQ